MNVRTATVDDLPRVLNLVTQMFRDLGTPVASAEWQHAARHRLEAADAIATVVATDDRNEPIAVAVGIIDERIPSPRRPDGRIGYVEWLATDPHYRRRGAARLVMTALLDWFDEQGVATVDVHASPYAHPLYQALGFRPPAATPLRRIKPDDDR
ncbi:GNAT family N-acetyltransferase [Cryptosporangium minutisporangium]|uniref:N-acetyltransferase domain-containing protein n=1 Tax=Cryptosporangium minutisporangium TaxID=113569 RepID=A0ABP6TC98_9ACTN